MIIDWEHEPEKPARVFDATGEEHERVTWCDTETGEIRILVVDAKGVVQLTPDKEEILQKQIMAPAPLRVEWGE